MNYDHELTLIGEGGYVSDDIGNQIPVDPIETTILCKLSSIGRSEFYNAAVAGFKPDFVFIVHAYEYSGENKVRFNEKTYRVIRTYQTGFEEMELICERVIRDG